LIIVNTMPDCFFYQTEYWFYMETSGLLIILILDHYGSP
jgi:hypothetical protein